MFLYHLSRMMHLCLGDLKAALELAKEELGVQVRGVACGGFVLATNTEISEDDMATLGLIVWN